MMVIGLAWSVANWFFSLAPIFSAADGCGFWRSLGETSRLYRGEQNAFISTGLWFSFARSVLIVASTMVSVWAFTQLRPHLAIALMIVTSLAYFACADALNMWRLACYISFTEPAPEAPVVAPPPLAVVPPTAVLAAENSLIVPQDESPASSDEAGPCRLLFCTSAAKAAEKAALHGTAGSRALTKTESRNRKLETENRAPRR
jgi:hypothetical protein